MTVTYGIFDEARLDELMRWFPDETSCRVWGGPHFRWPCSAATFREDAGIGVLASRRGHCGVSPSRRGFHLIANDSHCR
jgi:hypothetical protein